MGKLAAAAIGGAAVALSVGVPAYADVQVNTSTAAGGFTSATNELWLVLYEGKKSWIEWSTDTGLGNRCTVTTDEGTATCAPDFGAASTITLRLCSDMYRECSEWVTDRISR